jgi:short-subunit dehydrogenase
MNNTKRIVIVGATSSIAEHCARIWLQKQLVDLILVGRDALRTQRVADDLQVRSPRSDIQVLKADFLDPMSIGVTVRGIFESGSVDGVLIAHGSLPDQTECQTDLLSCWDALAINGASPVLFAEAFALEMQKRGRGTIALIGSVAGDRGRKSNYVYGAAKGLVTRYAQGLQHRFAGTGIKVVLVKPGPTDTPMTAHLKGKNARLAAVESVARRIVDGIDAGKQTVYAPTKWALVMMIIRHLPAPIFNRMDI